MYSFHTQGDIAVIILEYEWRHFENSAIGSLFQSEELPNLLTVAPYSLYRANSMVEAGSGESAVITITLSLSQVKREKIGSCLNLLFLLQVF